MGAATRVVVAEAAAVVEGGVGNPSGVATRATVAAWA